MYQYQAILCRYEVLSITPRIIHSLCSFIFTKLYQSQYEYKEIRFRWRKKAIASDHQKSKSQTDLWYLEKTNTGPHSHKNIVFVFIDA